MSEIIIHKSETADTRTAKEPVTKEVLKLSSLSHITDVQKAMMYLVNMMMKAAANHDHTKIDHLDEFYNDFYDTQTGKLDFDKESDWYKMHVTEERHHLDTHVPDDVNLIDVMEMICDCCMAGMARSGSFRAFTINNETLQKAVNNTCELLLKATKVVD